MGYRAPTRRSRHGSRWQAPGEHLPDGDVVPTRELKYGAAELEKMGVKLRRDAGLALYAAMVRGVSVIQTQIIPAKVPQPVDRGLYRGGWRAEPYMVGDQIMGGDIFNVELWAIFIEKGVRAANVKIGRAMLRALAEWAVRKKIVEADEDPKQVA